MAENEQCILLAFNEKEIMQFGSFVLEVANELNHVFSTVFKEKCEKCPELSQSKIYRGIGSCYRRYATIA